VQPTLDRLTQNGVVIRLRPQLMDLLVCLSAQPGRTVAKQELLATVWCDRFVAESGLARCVAELRQALGDSARQPRIIETIPKRGYRLIAPVAAAEPAAGATVGPPAAVVRDEAACPAQPANARSEVMPRGGRMRRALSRLRVLLTAMSRFS
jgi:DNA-binding winged helix-turn-helix (wHTH) protein